MAWTIEHQRFREQADAKTRRKFGAERVAELLERRRGQLNDGSSIGPGITIIFKDFRPETNGTMLEILERLNVEGAREAEDIEGCCVLELPEGGYANEGGGIGFYERVGPAGELHKNDYLFSTGWAFLLRVMGANGELTQNHSYRPDGSVVGS